MERVEFLRMRQALLWHIGILAAIAFLIAMLGGNGTSVNINGSTKFISGMGVPLGALTTIAAFFGAIFASSAGTSLNRENATRDISWTKPISRTALAVRIVAIDLAAVAIAYAAALAAIVAVLTHLHITPFIDAEAVPQLVLGLGIGMMWYAVIQAVSCTLPPGARALAGVMWPIAFTLGLATQVPGVIGEFARIINVVNPLSYLSNTSSGSHVYAAAAMPANERAAMVWCFTAAFCAVAVVIWPRKEA
jgi:hypothetical protein